MGELLTKVSYAFFGVSSANTNDSLQKIEVEVSPKLSQYRDELFLNPDLFKRVKSIYDNQSKFNLDSEQKFLLENLYKSFVRNGALLSQADQDTLKELNQKISVLSVNFNQNVLAETNKFKLVIDKESDLKGLPESVIDGAAERAKQDRIGRQMGLYHTKTKHASIPVLRCITETCAKNYMTPILQEETIMIALIIKKILQILSVFVHEEQNCLVIKHMLT